MREIFGDPDLGLPPGSSPEADEEYSRGIALIEHGDSPGAKSAFERADQLGHAGAPRELAQWALADDDMELWGDLVTRAYERGDGRAACWVAVATGDESGEKLDDLRFSDESGDPEGSRSLGLLLLQANGEEDGAEAAFRRSDARGSASGALALGILLRDQRHDFSGAESAFRRAEERGHPKGPLSLVDLYAERGDHAAADAARERVVELAARHPTTFSEMQDPDFIEHVRSSYRKPSAAAAGGGCALAALPVLLGAAIVAIPLFA